MSNNPISNLIAKFAGKFSEPQGDFEQGATVNAQSNRLNGLITHLGLAVLVGGGVTLWFMLNPSQTVEQSEDAPAPVQFGQVVDSTFTAKDNQSALSQQQLEIDALRKSLKTLGGDISSLEGSIKSGFESIQNEQARNTEAQFDGLKSELERSLSEVDALKKQLKSQLESGTDIQPSVNGPGSRFGDYNPRLPPPPNAQYSNDNPQQDNFDYQRENQVVNTATFEVSEFRWDATEEEARAKRTIDNYVPTGTFVTAVVTGGADANAGVSGQGDTAPIVFQTVNQGILPNGEKSKLNDCTITGSTYGEISSSRGIVRTHRMSCIQPDGGILDIPVKATAFNFGRNGIRGTTILKNGDIVEMAGISGILTGIGETGQALSQTTTPTALGPSQTVNGSDALINLLGNATSSVGSKLADYYIKLAELYHPIVEVNPGAVVNIVFLEGFPLDPLLADDYEAKVKREEQAAQSTPGSQLIGVLGGANLPAAASQVNPLAEKMAQEGLSPSQFGSLQ